MMVPGEFGDESGETVPEMHEINVTPFIDVMLVLLIIFMVAAPLATVDIKVDLPQSTAQQEQRPDKPLYLTLKADQTLALGDSPVTLDGLRAALDANTGGDQTHRVFVRGDKTVPYEAVMQTLDALRAAGYLKIALVGLQGTATK